MTSVATILIVAYIVALAALFAWLLRRKAKAASTYRKRAAVVAKLREQTDTSSPIVGWMVRPPKVCAQGSRSSLEAAMCAISVRAWRP